MPYLVVKTYLTQVPTIAKINELKDAYDVYNSLKGNVTLYTMSLNDEFEVLDVLSHKE